MPETISELSQYDRNVEVLRGSELGPILERVYQTAVNFDPRLAEAEILPMEEGAVSLANALPAWKSQTGRHQVRINTGNLAPVLARTQATLDRIPGARELFASKLDIPAADWTPQLAQVFGLAHELGHVVQYFDHETDPAKLDEQVRQDKMALPIGNVTVSAMMTAGTRAHQFVSKNWGDISIALEVNSLEQLYGVQHTAYRGMRSEAAADTFAANVLIAEPVLVDQMRSPNLDQYRVPIAA